MQADQRYIGADIGKHQIVLASANRAEAKLTTITNTSSAISRWLRGAPKQASLALEASGGYHYLLADMAQAQGLKVYVLNPKHVHHYAIALGSRGKTDLLDAQVIARYLAQEHDTLRRYERESEEVKELRELQALRAAVVKSSTLLRLSRQRLFAADGDGQVQALIDQMRQISDQMQAELVRRIKSSAETSSGYQLLTGITGIGALTGVALTILFGRIPFASSDAAVAYCGLDPRPKESGRLVGARRLSKQGDKRLRTLLYNAAAATLRNPAFKCYYQNLRSRGLASTQAVVIIARKLLRIAYGIWRTKRPFDIQATQLVAGLT